MAEMRRSEQTETELRKNILSLSKWDFLRQRRTEAEERVTKQVQQSR